MRLRALYDGQHPLTSPPDKPRPSATSIDHGTCLFFVVETTSARYPLSSICLHLPGPGDAEVS